MYSITGKQTKMLERHIIFSLFQGMENNSFQFFSLGRFCINHYVTGNVWVNVLHSGTCPDFAWYSVQNKSSKKENQQALSPLSPPSQS